ncbi:hypothetical protein BJ981_002910 [Sphaerisporangium krabiense]|uniref:Uncharacterized protein n=1 Tax=Sphaerisporangium krabiense TaxID=763782 RepID=A0A7W8Z4C0_9ACTN|nr:hypothetical protein [Sphaerisporangium krabiense]
MVVVVRFVTRAGLSLAARRPIKRGFWSSPRRAGQPCRAGSPGSSRPLCVPCTGRRSSRAGCPTVRGRLDLGRTVWHPLWGRRGDDHIPRTDPQLCTVPSSLRRAGVWGSAPICSFSHLHPPLLPRLDVCRALRVMMSGFDSRIGACLPRVHPLGEVPWHRAIRQPPSPPRRAATRGRADRGRTGRRAAAARGRARPPDSGNGVSGRSLDMSAVDGIKGCCCPSLSTPPGVPPRGRHLTARFGRPPYPHRFSAGMAGHPSRPRKRRSRTSPGTPANRCGSTIYDTATRPGSSQTASQ